MNLLLGLCEQRNSLSADSLMKFASEASRLAHLLKDREKIFLASYYIGTALEKKGFLDSADQLTDLNLRQLERTDLFALPRAKFIYLKGSLHVRKNEYKEAQSAFFQLLNDVEGTTDTVSLIAARHGIGWVYMETNQPSEAQRWFHKALATGPIERYEKYYAATYGNLIAVHGMLENFDSVRYYIDLAIHAATQHEQLSILCNAFNLEASLYMHTGRNHLAEKPLKKALEIRKRIGDAFYIVADMAQLASFYANAGLVDKALEYSKDGISLAEKNQITAKLPILYHSLANAYKLKGDLKHYSAAIEKLIVLKDALYQENTARAMAELDARYQLQKKENTIMQQEIKLIKRGYLLLILTAAIVLLAGGGFLGIKKFRRRQKTKMEAALLAEKLAAAKAVKDAEESERQRIAADLHDHLGAYAASIAHNLDVVTREIGDEKQSVRELRSNAQAMVSELGDTIWALKKDALRLTAISDRVKVFIQKLERTYSHFRFDIIERMDEDVLLPPSQAFHLLRIIQEAITNAVKHSKGDHITLRVESAQGWQVTVSDNGIGMLGNDEHESKNGMLNMKHRAKLSGWEIFWQSGTEGTKVVVCTAN